MKKTRTIVVRPKLSPDERDVVLRALAKCPIPIVAPTIAPPQAGNAAEEGTA